MFFMPSFSVVLIARNESKTLPRLIHSLTEFQKQGGEIVLMDTGSTDDTIAVAKSLGCRVHEAGERFLQRLSDGDARAINDRFVVAGEPPIVSAGAGLFDYAAARNHAASLASRDMVAMPDCDEQFTAFDLAEIERKISEGFEQLEYNFVFAHDEF